VAVSVLRGHRPQRPEAADDLGFTGELWSMVERCWQENPDERPEVKEIVDCLESAAEAWDTRRLPPTDAGSSDSENRRRSCSSFPSS